MNHISLSLIKIAQYLDDNGLYSESDKLTRIAQYAGPQNLNLPMESRVIPFSEMEEEFRDVARKRRQYFPRLQPKEHERDDAGDIMDINGPQGMTEEDIKKQHERHYDEDIDDEDIDDEDIDDEDIDSIFDINDSEEHEGASIFTLNGEPIGGITQRMYDPKGAGYMGINHFNWNNRDESKKGYPTYSPN